MLRYGLERANRAPPVTAIRTKKWPTAAIARVLVVMLAIILERVTHVDSHAA